MWGVTFVSLCNQLWMFQFANRFPGRSSQSCAKVQRCSTLQRVLSSAAEPEIPASFGVLLKQLCISTVLGNTVPICFKLAVCRHVTPERGVKGLVVDRVGTGNQVERVPSSQETPKSRGKGKVGHLASAKPQAQHRRRYWLQASSAYHQNATGSAAQAMGLLTWKGALQYGRSWKEPEAGVGMTLM